MKFKYLTLLILFILNISATVFADSSHVHNSDEKCQTLNEDHNAEENQTCTEHACCHVGHIHYCLLSQTEVHLNANSSKQTYPSYVYRILDMHPDLIKPPAV